MHTAWSANLTWSASASAVECTATDSRPISRHARITRRAISPRFAISTFLNIGSSRDDLEQPLTVLDRRAILDEDRDDRTGDIGLDLVHQLHRLHDAQHLSLLDLFVDRYVVWRLGIRFAIERAHERRGHEVGLVVVPRGRRRSGGARGRRRR